MLDRAVATAAPAPLHSRGRRRPKPPCPCCGQEGGLCEAHKQRLAGVAESLKEDGKRNRGGPINGRTARRRGSAPLCCNPHCWNHRTPPAAFCDDCQREGHVEEAA